MQAWTLRPSWVISGLALFDFYGDFSKKNNI